MKSHIIKAICTFLFKLTSSKAFSNARQVLNKPTSHTFMNGLKFNNKITANLLKNWEQQKQVWLVHGPWSHCHKAPAFEFHIAIYLTIYIAILTSNWSKFSPVICKNKPYLCKISNAKQFVWSQFWTPKIELKIWRANLGVYRDVVKRCLECSTYLLNREENGENKIVHIFAH